MKHNGVKVTTDVLVAKSLQGLDGAGDILAGAEEMTAGSPELHATLLLASLTIQGAAVYAALAQATATQEDMKAAIKRFPGRPRPPVYRGQGVKVEPPKDRI